jgi:hypothetical protein
VKGNAHKEIYYVEGGKKQENLVERPLTDSVNFEEDSLKEKKEETNPNDLSCDHQKEVRPIRHLPHQPDPYKEDKQFQISHRAIFCLRLEVRRPVEYRMCGHPLPPE